MEKQDYMDKAKNLLEHPMYRPLQEDSTNRLKAKLIHVLKRTKKELGMDDNMYRRMYPTGVYSTRFYGHKKDTPSGP